MKKVFLLLTLIAATFSAWGADYTVKRTFGAVAEEMGFANNGSTGKKLVLNNIITVESEKGGFRRDSAQKSIVFYSSGGYIKFQARENVTIKSITLKWKTRYDGGFLTLKQGGGWKLQESDALATGTKNTVNANSKSFWVGTASTTKDNPSIYLQEFEIVYTADPNTVVETLSSIPTTLSQSSTVANYAGDNGIYSWKVKDCRRNTGDLVNGAKGLNIRFTDAVEGYLAMNGNQEGGIKDISFDYLRWEKYPLHFYIKQGSTTLDDYKRLKVTNQDVSVVYNYTKELNIKSNVAISIINPKQESTTQTKITVGSICITPYLLFTAKDHKVSFNCNSGDTYDVKNVLINNTGTTPTYSITSNTCGGYPTISAQGVVNMSTVTQNGAIGIKATWGDVYTTLTINVTALPKQTMTFAEGTKNVTFGVAPFTNALTHSVGDGTISYESSNPSVASVNNDGTVTINAVGSAFIKAKAAKTAAFQAAEKSYAVNVARVSPAIAPAEITETKEIIWLSRENGYKTDTCYYNIKFNNAIAITAANKSWNNKIVGTYQGGLRYYQDNNNGQMNFVAKSGVTIKSVKVNYNGWNDGKLATEYINNGINVPTDKRVDSAAVKQLNANTYSLYTGSTKITRTNGRADVSAFTFVYTDPTIAFEKFSNYTSGTGSFKGDNGLYTWKANATNHTETVNGYTGFKLGYNNSITTDSIQEGGIKSVSFDYKSCAANLPVKMTIKAGDETYNYDHTAIGNTNYVITCTKDFNITKNAALSIAVGANESQAHVAVGPLHITPYLLFNVINRADTINITSAGDVTSINLMPLLINNTGTTPSFDVIENTVGGNPQITDGILDFSSVVRTGTIKVQAKWNSVTTTLTLNINLQDPKVSFADTIPTEKISKGWYKQALTLGTSTAGSKSYKVVSKPDGATATMSEDTIRFDKAGDYIIRGIIAASLPYAEDSAQYKLHVTDRNVPTLTFAADTVEQPISASTYKNELTTSIGVGDTTYDSSNKDVATVVKDGTVTLLDAGNTNITVSVAQNDSFAAGSKSYFLKVYAMPEMSFADGNKDVYLNQEPFTYAVTKTAGDGAITYESGDENVAEVNNDGKVTIKGAGTTTITANIAKGATYWSGSASYTLTVSTLKLPTASFGAETVVNKVQGFGAFTKEVTTESDGMKHYSSSDTRVATVNETTGEVTKGEKPGTTTISVSLDASDTWAALDNAAQYTLNVSAAKVADLHVLSSTITALKTKLGWEDAPSGGSEKTNIELDDVLTLSNGKHLYEDVYKTGKTDLLRFYRQGSETSASKFTIQAKAGVIIQTVKFTYGGNANTVLTDAYYSGTVDASKRILSGQTYKVDANAVTFHTGSIGNSPYNVDITGIEITYFDPSKGVAVTKTAFDLAKDQGLEHDHWYRNIKFNNAISLQAGQDGTLKYYNSGVLNCYRWLKPIDIVARPGATIHYVKITYTAAGPEGMLTKYYGTNGQNIPEIDRIASDSIIYVNNNTLRLYVGTTSSTDRTISITKIYVNYTDNSEVTVDNFDNCESKGTGSSEDVAGVDGKYDWKFTNFDRDNAQRMYYDQSVKINKNGKISTQYTGGLKEVAFDWHPTSNAAVDFTVNAGDSSWSVTKATQGGVYTFNFQKLNNKTNGEFSITVNSDAAVEVGHVSLTPYLIYTDKADTIAAKDYMKSGYINNTLINYTGKDVTYSIPNGDGIASINSTSGVVTILGGGTVTVNATADGATASYKLTINLETTSASFTKQEVNRVVTDGSYKQKLNIVTDTTAGNVINYEFVGEHDGATLSDSTVTFTKEGIFTIKGRLEQNLPYAAAEDTYKLIVGKPIPHIQFTDSVKSQKLSDGAFSVSLEEMPEGVGTLSYVSTNTVVATVDATSGLVTPLKAGVTYIKAYVTEGTEYAADSTSCKVIILGDPIPGAATVKGNIEEIASQGGWSDGDYRPYFRLDEVISVDDTAKANAYYQDASKSLRYLQNTKKGQFTIRAKAGVIIQSVKLTYTSENGGVVTNNYGTEGKKIVEANQYLSGKTYKVDANRLDFYTGSTTDNANGEVYIKGIEVNYFKSPVGVAVTKNVIDLAKQYNLKDDTSYMSLALDNVVTMSVAQTGTMKYLDGENLKELRFYQTNGPVTISAREGAKINYVKVTYSGVNNGVFTTDACRSSVPVEEQVASDSILYVNAQSISLYPSSYSTNTNGQPRVRKIYVNYTDSKAIVDNFDNCTKIYGGDNATKVMGVDSTFEWEFTQFNRDSLRRIGYDQSTMLRQAGGKIAANNVDGGIKEVSFDWFASNSNQGVKFNVKAGGQTFNVDSAAAGGYYPITYTLTDIKTNGAFSIEMDPASGSQMEVGHISLTPYMFYKEKEANVKVGGEYKNESLVDFRDSEEDITYSSSKDSVATVDEFGTVTAQHVGTATITAKWGDVTTSYTINVAGDKTTIYLMRNDGTDKADTIVNNYGETIPNPSMALPTRNGWRFNAYFPDAAASKGSERITYSAWDKTYWVANVMHSNGTVQMTDSARKWIYEGANYTLYAQWMPELTIALDNQGATTAGTEQVKTAKCPNNDRVNLSQNITIPAKDGYTFLGYFTADSVKLIEANGAFLADVAGYTNSKKMWQKNEGTTLYAYWDKVTITLDEALNNDSVINSHIGEVVGQVDLVRTLAAGKYNTFCVPFDITKADLATALNTEIVSLATLDEKSEARLEDNKLFIYVVELEDDSVMHAGKPYLLQIAEEVSNPSFSSVKIGKANDSIVSSDKSVEFHGITSKFKIPNDKKYLFLSNNLLSWNNTQGAADMKGLRAYFYVPGMVNPSQVSARLVMRQPTDLEDVNANVNEVRKMVIDNQLIIIRNGVRYNANGQVLKMEK